MEFSRSDVTIKIKHKMEQSGGGQAEGISVEMAFELRQNDESQSFEDLEE